MPTNHIIVLDNRPEGEATAANFKLIKAETPQLQEGQVLVKHHYLSLDPYMRGRMNAGKNYAQPQPLGEAMIGGTVGEVLDSKHAKFKVGQTVQCMGGWPLLPRIPRDGKTPNTSRLKYRHKKFDRWRFGYLHSPHDTPTPSIGSQRLGPTKQVQSQGVGCPSGQHTWR